MLKIYTLLFFLCSGNFLIAQNPCASLNYHAFKATALDGEYVDLNTLGEEIAVNNLDDGNSEPLEIGFDFEYQCQVFTQFIFNTNGFIKLGAETNPKTNLFFSGAQSTSGGIFNSPDSNHVNMIAVFNHDIENITGDPEFRMHITGNAPNRVCTIQWEDMQEWSSDPATKQYIDMDFQLKLYETTNVIEFVYGDWGPSVNPSNFKTAAIGLKGKSSEDDQLLVVVKNSAAFWDNVVFKNGNYASNEAFNFGNPTDRPKPDIGRTYRFTPTNENDLTVRQVYALGDASLYYSSPQTISAVIENRGFETQLNVPVMLEVSGANTYRDTQYISKLDFVETARITFSEFSPTTIGLTTLRVSVGGDDNLVDNNLQQVQQVNDFDLNYTLSGPEVGGYGFQSGVQGIYYAKYPVHGTAKINNVIAFIAIDTPSIGKTVFGMLLNASGAMIARSENYIIQESDLGGWHSFAFADPPVISNSEFYAGMGMTTSLTTYAPLGVQDEVPLRSKTYYSSLITGSGLKAMDTLTFAYRFMIGATLSGTSPIAGVALGDASFCVGGFAVLGLEGHTGFVAWQESIDGLGGWEYVASGGDAPSYISNPLNVSTYYRAEVFQPGFDPVYSNVVFIEVKPENPVITASGDVLQSSVVDGNQWYDQNGIIPGAIGQLFIAPVPGTYYVIVTSGECVSSQSNEMEIISVGIDGTNSMGDIRIYPNPVGEEMYIDAMNETRSIKYELINALGQTIYRDENATGGSLIKTGWIQPGLYFLRIQINEVWEMYKVVKE